MDTVQQDDRLLAAGCQLLGERDGNGSVPRAQVGCDGVGFRAQDGGDIVAMGQGVHRAGRRSHALDRPGQQP